MLRPRIVPCLLIQNKGLVKTVKFKDPKYVGDPLNAVRIFNEKEVDELIVIDIDATRERRGPDMNLIKNIAHECNMPLCYGGGVTTAEQAKQIINLGAEKVAISSAIIQNPLLVNEIASAVGSQSVICVIDAKKKIFGGYEAFIYNGTKGTGRDPIELAALFEQEGAGEILINSIDQDGTMQGYDHKLIEKIRDKISLPMTILGGVGEARHISDAFTKYKIIGAAAGSYFVFKGKYKAVLISYPNREEKRILYKNAL